MFAGEGVRLPMSGPCSAPRRDSPEPETRPAGEEIQSLLGGHPTRTSQQRTVSRARLGGAWNRERLTRVSGRADVVSEGRNQVEAQGT